MSGAVGCGCLLLIVAGLLVLLSWGGGFVPERLAIEHIDSLFAKDGPVKEAGRTQGAPSPGANEKEVPSIPASGIEDTSPPTLEAGPDIEATTDSTLGISIDLQPQVELSDNDDGSPRLTFLVEGRSVEMPFLFPPGRTKVVVRATDAAGNVSEDEVVVTVSRTE